ncbi:MAG: hypothetical protein A3205_01560 [Methanomassiliicoccales archaeon Mx-03]|nr:MAG: hypothetical protein A3205_01560 [Methanomassiliicoccales archaeon Mx-03]
MTPGVKHYNGTDVGGVRHVDLDSMERDYRLALGDCDAEGEITEEQWDDLALLRDSGNVLAMRRMADHYLNCGSVDDAGDVLLRAVEEGDTESALRLISDRRFSDDTGCSDAQRRAYDLGASRCDGFVEDAVELAEGDGDACGVLILCTRNRIEYEDDYIRFLDIGLHQGSSVARHAKASDILQPGFWGECVEDLDDALGLMESAARGFWRPRLVLGQLYFTGRYVDRDESEALDHIILACRMTGNQSPRDWLSYMADMSEGPEHDHPREGEIFRPPSPSGIPEARVLRDITATWFGRTLYEPLSNMMGAFENDLFAFLPSTDSAPSGIARMLTPPSLLFKPTGYRIADLPEERGEYASEHLSRDEFRRMLALCIDSARDSIRGLGA